MEKALLDKIDVFFTQYKNQKYKKGEILMRADDNPPGVFYLKEGNVKEYAISKSGDELVINIYKPIAFFPMSWAINETSSAYFFEAMTNVEVWRTPRKEVIAFIKSNPDVLYNLMSRVYKGLDGVLTRMIYLMSGHAYARLIVELLIYARRFGSGQNMVEIHVSEKDLAAQSGMTRETVSREMKILKKNGFIKMDKTGLVIRNVQKLEEELAKVG